MNLAIVIGIDRYSSELFDDLPACKNDATAMAAVFSSVKAFEDILFVESGSGAEAKRKISDFIEKYKGKDVSEFTFYFSGHGERLGEDFFYVFTDFERTKKRNHWPEKLRTRQFDKSPITKTFY